MSVESDLVFYVRRQDNAGLSNLACSILNAPDTLELMRDRSGKFCEDGVMLHDCEADTWANSTIDKDTAYTWLRDALLYFCVSHPDRVRVGIKRQEAGMDKDLPRLDSGTLFIVRPLTP